MDDNVELYELLENEIFARTNPQRDGFAAS